MKKTREEEILELIKPGFRQITQKLVHFRRVPTTGPEINLMTQTLNGKFPGRVSKSRIFFPEELAKGKINCLTFSILASCWANQIGIPHAWFAFHDIRKYPESVSRHWTVGIPTSGQKTVSQDDATQSYDRQRNSNNTDWVGTTPLLWLHWIPEDGISLLNNGERPTTRSKEKMDFFSGSLTTIIMHMLCTYSPPSSKKFRV